MDLSIYPTNVQEFLSEFIKRGIIDPNGVPDKTFINFLYTQRFDKDYIDAILYRKR
ncbi:hypothetical protein [Thermotalea metallivorans]|uniref:Uncharacterized protein n=1 Tax=Thermotalea metallivorans TaxID=520762 RepID=A0A140L3A9_9FIRM|nr:hypothetical protein [Thermotalea metallivorans]KXG75034.1 hypothetical protein AN619_20040 [Thermotalea metallivorans]